jgi:hypothetical protein
MSSCAVCVTRRVTIEFDAKSQPLTLDFEPYQSLLQRVA